MNAHRYLPLGLVLFACVLCGPSPALAEPPKDAPAKVETKPFNDFFTAQSQKLYGHLIKAAEYYNSLDKTDENARAQDVLAIRASLSACWELFLNAGDMVYVYDQISPDCPETLDKVRQLAQNGLKVVAGKLEKELAWLDLARERVKDIPVSIQAKQAEKDIKETARAFREYAALFAVKPADAPADGVSRSGAPDAAPTTSGNEAKENTQ